MGIPYAAGSLYSTTHDLLTWNKALAGGKVVKPVSFQRMTTPVKGDYGFGLRIANQHGYRSISHAGGINGFGTIMTTYPDEGLTVIVLNNAQGAAGEIEGKLSMLMFGKPVTLPSERKEVTLDARVLARYVGRYELRPGFVLEITSDGKALTGQATNQPKIPLFAEGEKEFFTRAIDSQITFVVEGDGPATALVMHQGGRDTTARRIP
jgi:CubicO group peptidase (beta-lactamase class C family)